MSEWLKVELWNGDVITSSPEVLTYFATYMPSVEFTYLVPQYSFWIILWLLSFFVLNVTFVLLERRGYVRPTTWQQRVTASFHGLNTCGSLLLFIVSIITLAAMDSTLYQTFLAGSLGQADNNDVSVLTWDQTLDVSGRLKLISIWVGYGVVPLILLFCVELFTIGMTIIIQGTSKGESLLFVHHIVAMFLMFMSLEPVLGMFFLLHSKVTFR